MPAPHMGTGSSPGFFTSMQLPTNVPGSATQVGGLNRPSPALTIVTGEWTSSWKISYCLSLFNTSLQIK